MIVTQNEIINNHEKVNAKINKDLNELSKELVSVSESLDKANETIENNKIEYEKSLGEKDIAISKLKREARPQAPNRGGSRISKQSNLGTFNSTAYCSCTICCGPNAKGITASGTKVQAGRTIAVDPKVIPLGSKVLVDGKQYIAEDTGSAIKGKIVDIYFDNHSTALAWGRKNVDVKVVQ